jgi:transcriptional regulator with XRE-family HTH domain
MRHEFPFVRQLSCMRRTARGPLNKTSHTALDYLAQTENHGAMARKRVTQFKKMYIGEWADRRGVQPRDLADAVGISEGYMSELVNGKKHNPSLAVLMKIVDRLGLERVDDLFQPPPSQEVLNTLGKLSPADQAALSRLLQQARGTK